MCAAFLLNEYALSSTARFVRITNDTNSKKENLMMLKSLKNALLTIVFGGICAMGAGAQASQDHAPAATPSATATQLVKIRVLLSEMKFEIEGQAPGTPLVLKAGQHYKIAFENVGTVLHEVLFGRGLITNGHEHDYQTHLMEGLDVDATGAIFVGGEKRIWAVETTGLKEIELEPGTRVSILFTLPDTARGTWELGCFALGHHEAGMFIPLIVE
jgi:uncharacterized cupredoxin-like copper-binding protein